MINLRSITIIFAILSATICVPSGANSSDKKPVEKDSRPNIVLMIADDHGREAIGAYGNPVVRTPNIDRLAKEGVKFTNAFGTTASCSASRSVILSGLHNHANGMYGHEHDYHHFSSFSNIKSLPLRLEAAGYRTARVGKFHVAPESVYHFQTVFPFRDQDPMDSNQRDTIGMAKVVKPFIDAKDERPFFLYLATNDPHRDHAVNSLGDNSFGNISDKQGLGMKRLSYRPEGVIVPHYLSDTIETRRELAEYYQSIKRVDDTLGLLIAQLKAANKLDNTLIIYMSDNGTAMPGSKTTVYDPGIQLPLIIRPAKTENVKGGATIENLVSWTDITPTLLDYANAPVSASEFHGRSFRNAINGKAYEPRTEIYASHTFHEITMYYPMRLVRNKEYKLIWNIASGLEYPFASDLYEASTWQSVLKNNVVYFGKRKLNDFLHRSKFELYNLKKDPEESINLANNPDYAAIKEELQGKLKAFQKETGDPWVTKWDYE